MNTYFVEHMQVASCFCSSRYDIILLYPGNTYQQIDNNTYDVC